MDVLWTRVPVLTENQISDAALTLLILISTVLKAFVSIVIKHSSLIIICDEETTPRMAEEAPAKPNNRPRGPPAPDW